MSQKKKSEHTFSCLPGRCKTSNPLLTTKQGTIETCRCVSQESLTILSFNQIFLQNLRITMFANTQNIMFANTQAASEKVLTDNRDFKSMQVMND